MSGALQGSAAGAGKWLATKITLTKPTEKNMAGIKDILTIEQSRQGAESWRVVHLFKEGTFYRAYEQSAWLYCTRVHAFKVTHRRMKGLDESLTFIGFPVTSLAKRAPEGCVVSDVDDSHVALTLPAAETAPLTDDEMAQAFSQWKSEQPLVEPQKDEKGSSLSDRKGSPSQPAPQSVLGIMQQILAYPIEHKSPVETMNFVAELKQTLAHIL